MKFNESLEAKKKSTVSQIHRHFDELTKAMGNRKQEMVEKATSLTNSKQKLVRAQLEILQMALASCESSIEFTEHAFKNGHDVQILSMEKYILQSFEQLKTVKDQTEPCVTQNMVFIIPSSVQETNETLLTKYDVRVDVAEPTNYTASFKEDETVLAAGKKYSIALLICSDTNDRRMRYGGQVIKPSFSGLEVRDVVVTDNKDGSYTISFCPNQCGMLSFEVFINGIQAPQCSLTKQVKWVISDVDGSGDVTNGGNTMRGVGRVGQYCCRIGWCLFESGVHTWKVELRYEVSHDNYGDNFRGNNDPYNDYSNAYNRNDNHTAYGDIGIIDYDGISAGITSNKKWVYRCSVGYQKPSETLSLTLDMERRTLKIRSNCHLRNSFQFTAPRVMPFFSSSSPRLSLSLVE